MTSNPDSPPQQKKEKTDNIEAEKLRTIFSEEEIRSTVKAFTLAYLRGQIKIDFDTVTDIQEEGKLIGKKISYEDARKEEVKDKKEFVEHLDIITGTTKATPEELDRAVKDMFSIILAMRAGERIKGTFLEFDIERKIDDIEQKLTATNSVVEQLVKWLIDSEKGMNGNLS